MPGEDFFGMRTIRVFHALQAFPFDTEMASGAPVNAIERLHPNLLQTARR
jgi:hypothetical protein